MSVSAYEYATFSYDAYNPSPNNRVTYPSGWGRHEALSSGGNDNPGALPEDSLIFGFGAAVYRNSSANEVVIAFRGTETTLSRVFQDAASDVLAGLFAGSPQLMQAIDLYIEVRKAFPEADISLTGHSLGGGLASMLAILCLPVQIKVQAFRFQRYGMLDGELITLGADSSTPQQNPNGGMPSPALYKAIVSVRPSGKGVIDQQVLAAGMTVSAEIDVGTRTPLQYLLDPVRGTVGEAGREK